MRIMFIMFVVLIAVVLSVVANPNTTPQTNPTNPPKTCKPKTKPSEHTTKALKPSTKSPVPTTKPSKPSTKSREPTTRPSGPTTNPPEPMTKPLEPTTKPPEPTTKPPEPTTIPPKPTTKPPEPTTNRPKPGELDQILEMLKKIKQLKEDKYELSNTINEWIDNFNYYKFMKKHNLDPMTLPPMVMNETGAFQTSMDLFNARLYNLAGVKRSGEVGILYNSDDKIVSINVLLVFENPELISDFMLKDMFTTQFGKVNARIYGMYLNASIDVNFRKVSVILKQSQITHIEHMIVNISNISSQSFVGWLYTKALKIITRLFMKWTVQKLSFVMNNALAKKIKMWNASIAVELRANKKAKELLKKLSGECACPRMSYMMSDIIVL